MRSLAAWSICKEEIHQRQELMNHSQEQERQNIQDELLAINEKLLDTIMLYGSARVHHQQKKVLNDWISEQGDIIRFTIDEQTEKIRSSLTRSLADAVGPLLKDVIEKQAVVDFCSMIEKVAFRSISESSVINVPMGLHEAMLAEIQRRGLKVQMDAAEGQEITFESGETSFQTTIGDAVVELEGILSK
jgi:hypothetical protein